MYSAAGFNAAVSVNNTMLLDAHEHTTTQVHVLIRSMDSKE